MQGERLFRNITDVSGSHNAFRHVARMVALIGKPPSMFLQRSNSSAQCFEPDGKSCLSIREEEKKEY